MEHLELQRVHLRSGTVDFVEEEGREVGAVLEDGAGIHARAAVFTDVGVVDKVGRHQVDGALDALVGAADSTRHCAQQRGLADADVALEQNVAAREHRQGDQVDGAILTHDGGLQCGFKGVGAITPVGKQILGHAVFLGH